MNNVKCIYCGQQFPLVRVYASGIGEYTICPNCGGRFDTDEKVELSDEQSKAVDDVYKAVYTLCQELTANEHLEWDISYIDEIADCVTDILAKHGLTVRFPAVVADAEGEWIEEYVKPGVHKQKW